MFGRCKPLVAQPAGREVFSSEAPTQGLPWSIWRDDPIGLEPTDEALDKVQPTRKTEHGIQIGKDGSQSNSLKTGSSKIPTGEILSALSSVSESQHRTAAHFLYGFAVITESMRFVSLSDVPSIVCYRQAVPNDASLISLQACNHNGCRAGLIDATLPAQEFEDCSGVSEGAQTVDPVARVILRSDSRGSAGMIRAGWVKKGDDLTIDLQYLVRVRQHQGVTRLRIPARGSDARAAATTVQTVTYEGSISADAVEKEQNAVTLEPWLPIDLVDRSSAAVFQAYAWQYRCGAQKCGRVRISSPPQTGKPVDMAIAIDASPSMKAISEHRFATALAVLLAAVPAGSRVRALAFASKAKVLIDRPVDALRVPLASLIKGITSRGNLGSTTRLERVWEVTDGWFKKSKALKLRPLIVVIGDGGLTESGNVPFFPIKRSGVELSVLNISDRPTKAWIKNATVLTGGIAVNAGSEAEEAANGRGAEPFEERVAALFAPIIARRISVNTGRKVIHLGTLRAGEECVWEGFKDVHRLRVSWAGRRVQIGAPPKEISRSLGSQPPMAKNPSSPHSDQTKNDSKLGAGMPSGPLLSMLRQRVIPIARGCFRKDRAGRSDYHQRIVYILRLANQEVIYADIEGNVKQELKQCLLKATDVLDVPRFYGTVFVRYPLVTEAEPTAEPIELAPEVLQQVDDEFCRNSDVSR